MFKRILTGVAFIFVGLLPSARGDEGLSESHPSDDSSANLIVSFKENCPEYQSPFLCFYWASNELTNFHAPKSVKSKATVGNEFSGKDFPESFIEFPENHLQKRFLIARRKTPAARGYKRGPGFRSWGGKRDFMSNWENLDKRTKFGSWGGKRDGEHLSDDLSSFDSEERAEKRAKFQNWGGKRSTNDLRESQKFFDVSNKRGPIWKDRSFYLSEPYKKAVPKRPQFQSWGGKRAVDPWRKLFGFFKAQAPGYSVNGGEKRKFSSWGGKRYENNGDDVLRDAFQNREGQRVSFESDSAMENMSSPKKSALDDNAMQKRTFNTVQQNWKNDEHPFMSWQEQGKEDKDTR